MKFTIAIISLLAGIAIATPAAAPAAEANVLDARGFDCRKCGCSSAEACTFDCCQ
ncbi:hypothetical protein QBC37DRAFT_372168 [Rhypophila decipiens]|uniref:Uncharacterized protein n=1 Tax=Rhypophila decipiens TaxID=261697 RepID=A0AAN7BBT6_9PEZI|nr:hypothetical protein QBC37DRAFT_372168 [Rhypophila decipiens]